MAWSLNIRILDVGPGDCSFIVADDPDIDDRRVLMIDGGFTSYGQLVNSTIQVVGGPDTILVTHYDKDHVNGVTALLAADNLSNLCTYFVEGALDVVPVGGSREEWIARLAAQMAAVARGAIDDEATTVGVSAYNNVPAGLSDGQAAAYGAQRAAKVAYSGGPLLLTANSINTAAKLVGIGAYDAFFAGSSLGQARAHVRQLLFYNLATCLPVGGRFDTEGRCRLTRVIDVGDATAVPASYGLAVRGELVMATGNVMVPNLIRDHTTFPGLGSEVLHDDLIGPTSPDAPVAIVVSTPLAGANSGFGTAWNGPNPPIQFAGDTPPNRSSIGLVVTFGDFSYFTAGDLPEEGENPLGVALTTHPLPDGQVDGGLQPAPITRLTCLRCSHHGSDTSTSQAFFDTMQPVIAMISCGDAHGAPVQSVIDTLYTAANPVDMFWLTNCSYVRVGVPASENDDQLTAAGNRSRVAGDNSVPNDAPNRRRGNIWLSLNEEDRDDRILLVTYYELDLPGAPAYTTMTVDW